MEMQFKNEIKKLADVVVWADNAIKEMRMDFPDLPEEEFKDLPAVNEFETVKKVVFEAMNRHIVYTNALNNDIASKDAKIEKLEKEIEGRKKAFNDLREEMANRYIAIETHNDICKTYEDKVTELEKEIERLNRYTANVDKVNHDLVAHVTLLESGKEEIEKLKVDLIHEREKNEKLAKAHAELENEIKKRYTRERALENTIDGRRKDIESWKHDVYEELKKNEELEETIEKLKKERDKYMARVNDLRMELDCVKASKEKYEEAAHDKLVGDLRDNIKYWRTKYLATQEERDVIKEELAGKNDLIKNLVQEIEYYKNQERIRTDQLRATESKVDQLSREKEEKEKDHGKSGFTEYIKYVIAEEEGKFKAELNKRFSEEVSKISQERTEEELAKAKLNEKFGVGGIVDEFKEGIPCGEDAIE